MRLTFRGRESPPKTMMPVYVLTHCTLLRAFPPGPSTQRIHEFYATRWRVSSALNGMGDPFAYDVD